MYHQIKIKSKKITKDLAGRFHLIGSEFQIQDFYNK